jgi:3-hydroxymyristoyl/3-hydroxydecanoyl-(acyl carrier protein) dehydratase
VAPRIVEGTAVPGKSATATLHVPESAPFFADHFPRRPVFPATLLLDSQIRLALRLAADANDLPLATKLVPVRMTHVKMRSFIAPGDVLELAAERAPSTDGVQKMLLSAQSNGKSIATARLELISEEA